MSSFVEKLAIVHRRLDAEVRRELGHRLPDTVRLLRLKKLKLQIKDRLYSLKQSGAGA